MKQSPVMLALNPRLRLQSVLPDPYVMSSSKYIRKAFYKQFRRQLDAPPIPNAGDGSDGTFNPDNARIQPIMVRAQTTNGPLLLEYIYQAPGVVLDSGAFTSNGEASTKLHRSYQGSFMLSSINGDLRVPEANDLEPTTENGVLDANDPWNLNRSRVIVFDRGNDTAYGTNLSSPIDDSQSPYGYTRGKPPAPPLERSFDLTKCCFCR